jgi:hypothetical protein
MTSDLLREMREPAPTAGEVAMPLHPYDYPWSDAELKTIRAYGDARASHALARVPLTRKQLADGWHADHATHNSQFSIDWFLAGARFAEEQHGILPAPTEGGAA